MMRPLVLLTLLSVPVGAAEIPASVPAALRPFAPLVGTDWVATFPGGALRDEQRFEWVYDGRFLRNLHWVRDAAGTTVYEGETIYAWDPLAEQLVWWYWNATGGYIVGTMTASEGGWLAEGVNHAPGTQTPRVRGVIRKIAADSWESVQYFDRDGSWVERFAMVFRPLVEAKEPTPPPTAWFLVQFSTGPAWDAARPPHEQAYFAEHSANLRRLRDAGRVAIGGRHGDLGTLIVEAADLAAARAEIERDPAVANGTFAATVELFQPFYHGCLGEP